MSLSTKILIGLVLGILTGLFFGEKVAFLGPAGRAFLLLLQMTVLPYVVVALMKGIGSLDFDTAKLLARKAGSILVVIWLLTLGVVFLFPIAFPNWESASYFSPTLVETAEDFEALLGIVWVMTLFPHHIPILSLLQDKDQVLQDGSRSLCGSDRGSGNHMHGISVSES
jgi:Na+/H+-dicarboxylate symporter